MPLPKDIPVTWLNNPTMGNMRFKVDFFYKLNQLKIERKSPFERKRLQQEKINEANRELIVNPKDIYISEN